MARRCGGFKGLREVPHQVSDEAIAAEERILEELNTPLLTEAQCTAFIDAVFAGNTTDTPPPTDSGVDTPVAPTAALNGGSDTNAYDAPETAQIDAMAQTEWTTPSGSRYATLGRSSVAVERQRVTDAADMRADERQARLAALTDAAPDTPSQGFTDMRRKRATD